MTILIFVDLKNGLLGLKCLGDRALDREGGLSSSGGVGGKH